jgi:Spherulation-specific family 4
VRRASTLLLLALSLGAATSRAAEPVRLLVPAYFYPAGDGRAAWNRLIASAGKVPIVAIVDPDNGPGKTADPNYQSVFKSIAPSKLTPIGYVTLSYGKRTAATVKADVDQWRKLYPGVRGIFFDEQPSDAAHSPFARECYAYARAQIRDGVFFSNPGVPCAPEYFADADGPTFCLFEHHEGFDAYQPPPIVDRVGPKRVAVLLYSVKPADATRRFRQALQKQAGTVYVTDATGVNPWDRLPSYWEAEVSEAARGRP